MNIIQTAERVSSFEPSDKVIHCRHLIAYHQASKLIYGKTLEIGCGEGYALPILIPNATEYIALDKENLAKQIRKTLKSEKLEMENMKFYFHQQTAPLLDSFPDKCMDCVVSFQVIEHIENDQLFIEEIRRVLRPGGKLILTTPHKKMSLTRNPYHVKEYLYEELSSLIHRYFKKVTIQGIQGNAAVMKYYQANKKSVHRLMRYDFLNLQYRLPAWILKVPYDFMNRYNRKELMKGRHLLFETMTDKDFSICDFSEDCLDFFIVAE